MKWTPKDIVAGLVIMVAASLLHRGIDTTVGWSLLGVVATYYGINLTIARKHINSEKKKEEDKGGTTD
jgi:hypothetical protein